MSQNESKKVDWSEDLKKSWEESVLNPAMEKSPEKNLLPSTHHVPQRKRIYFPRDEAYLENIGFPGSFPFTRGVHATMYRSKYWTMRQYAGFATAKKSNERYRYLFNQGQTGLSVAFDLPTQMGLDSDHPMAKGEVGRVGVAIDTLEDMKTLLEGLPLDQISTSMTINATAPILLSFYLATAKEKKIPLSKIRGTIQNDLLKEYIARGTYIYPPEGSLRLITDVMDYCSKEVPKWNTMSISGYHIREAGATAIQEVAFTLANAIAYVESAQKKNLDIEKVATRLSFFFNVHNDLLEEVSKFRAARRLWARITKNRFGLKNPKAMLLRFHAQTAGSTLTAQQPYNNVVRVTLQALAAVLGGAQSLHTNSMDEALGLPTEQAVTLALRTQQVLAHESGISNSVDPVAGSYLIEELTDQIEKGAQDYIDKIDAMGGMVKAIEQGFPQREIQNSAYEYQKQLEDKKRIVVGVNQYVVDEDTHPPILQIDENIEKDQILRLVEFRKKRNSKSVQEGLEKLKQRAQEKDNLMPHMLESVTLGATLGEISDTLKQVFGAYHEVKAF